MDTLVFNKFQFDKRVRNMTSTSRHILLYNLDQSDTSPIQTSQQKRCWDCLGCIFILCENPKELWLVIAFLFDKMVANRTSTSRRTMDRCFRFFKKIFRRRSPDEFTGVQWRSSHLSIVDDYLQDISRMGYVSRQSLPFEDLHMFAFFCGNSDNSPKSRMIKAKKMASWSKKIRDIFKVPRPIMFHQTQNHHVVIKHQLVETFISFLLQLLHHKPANSIVIQCNDRIGSLEKELGFLPTILGDISVMLGGPDHNEDQNLLKEFEAVANEAGTVVHVLLFSKDRDDGEMLGSLGVVLNHIDLLKANIMTFLNHMSSHMITPKTSVVKSLLIVNSLINHLEDLMGLKDNLIADVKDQIITLHQALSFVQSSIKDYKGSPRIGELKEGLMRIGDLANGAEYLIISFLFGEAPLWYVINRLTNISKTIQLNGIDILEIINRYKLGDLNAAWNDVSLEARRHLEVDDVMVGFEDRGIHILNQLLDGTKSLQVISIFGMPGLGKTTLAKKFYNHSSVKSRFDRLSWCVISQICQSKCTMTSILIQIAGDRLEKDSILQMGEESLEVNIYKTLKGRRYLIVMDDIWDLNVWDDLRRCFPDDGNGSRILFTTRNKDVAVGLPYALPYLTDSQCWELLRKRMFDNEPCPHDLVWTGKKIAANCCGLPLAVVVIAGVLSAMDKEINRWKKVEHNLASYILDDGDDTVMQILELSYVHLPEYLKPCFLYFGAFEEDREIPIGDLARLWIAEGFIHKEVGKSAENVAEEYLQELIDKSLVMVTKRRSDGGAKTCVVHDLLHNLCFKRLKEENLLKFVDNIYVEPGGYKNRDYSTYEKGHRLVALEEHVSWKYCYYASSLHHINYPISRLFYFRHSRFLRVMHCNFLGTHLIRTENVVCLRYLVVQYLRAEIGSLVNLEYLLVDSRRTVNIPSALLKMNKLRYINVASEAIYDRDCSDSSQTNNIEFLSRVFIGEARDEEMLKRSPNLRKLKLLTFQHLHLGFLTQLEVLNVEFRGFTMAEITFPSTLKKLTLCGGFRMSWENMSGIGRLEKLEVFKLESCAFEEEEKDARWDTRDWEFQELTFLKLENIKNLTQWNVESSQHFPKLKRLILRNCYCLEEIPGEIGEIPTLEMIEVEGQCPESLVESAKSVQQQQLDMGNEELNVVIKFLNPQEDLDFSE